MLEKLFKGLKASFSSATLGRVYLGGLCILVAVLAWYQLLQGEYYWQRAKNNYLKVIPLPSIRGTIFDRNQMSIAYDQAAFNLAVIPYEIRKSKQSLFKDLSISAGLSLDLLNRNYKRNMSGFFSPVDIVTNMDKLKTLKLKQEFSDTTVISTRPQRYYPMGYEFAHLLGYVKPVKAFYEQLKNYGYSPRERTGFKGIEQFYDTYLKGRDGGELIEVDSRGRVMGFLGQSLPERGKDIYLSLDSHLQQAAYDVLDKRKGVIILMDSGNGEILTLCSRPAFNLNNFIKGKNVTRLFSDPQSPLLNRAIQARYPIGSTFKPILAAAGLEEDKLNPLTTFNCQGDLRLGIARFRCWTIHGQQNLVEALAHSCNVYFYNLGLKLGPNLISRWARYFDLDSATGIDLPSEGTGFIPDVRWKQKKLKSNWFAGDTVNFSIGQGYMTATPLAVTRAINVFASGGYLVRPHLIKKIGSVESGASAKSYCGLSESTLRIVRQGLRETVLREDGTARLLSRLNLNFSGKTGTAQNPGKSHGWFAGFFTYQGKTYTICVLIEHGGSSYEAVKAAYYFIKKITENKRL